MTIGKIVYFIFVIAVVIGIYGNGMWWNKFD
jgi:hypothetical protein